MLTPEESKNIRMVYIHLLESEKGGWDSLDDSLELLEYLEDDQIVVEAEVALTNHKGKNMGCPHKHQKGDVCPVTNIIDATESILTLYRETFNLHEKNRYIISYYIALTNMGMIVESSGF